MAIVPSSFADIPEELVHRYDVQAPRYTSYPTAPEWTDEFGPGDYARGLDQAAAPGAGPLSLYVHIPFCRERCTFCGCNVVIDRRRDGADRYLDVVAKEVELVGARLGARRDVAQLHWGGGTPTYLDEGQIRRLWEALSRRFALLPEAEVAVEINPGTTTGAQLALLRALGFNRLSMGVQDFDPQVQRAIGRIQTVEQTRTLMALARELGFGGVNVDLVYGLPLQAPEGWARTLDEVIAMRPDRLAIYSFAYVPWVRPHQRAIAPESLPSGKAKLDLFRQASAALAGAGYRCIGMDHFALPDDPLWRAKERRQLKRNFQGYTVSGSTDVLAFGVSGISDVQGSYAQNVLPLPRYAAALAKGRLATARGIHLSEDDRRRRAIIQSLLCDDFVDLGVDGARVFAPELEALQAHQRDGLVRLDGAQVELTPIGRFFARNVALVFDRRLRERSGRPVFSRTV